MSITKELENINELEAVGFDHKQAKAITKIVEQSHVDSHETLKDFIRGELDSKINGLRNDLNSNVNGLRNDLMCEIKDLKVSIAESQKVLLIKLFGIIVGTVGLAVTILKLFP